MRKQPKAIGEGAKKPRKKKASPATKFQKKAKARTQEQDAWLTNNGYAHLTMDAIDEADALEAEYRKLQRLRRQIGAGLLITSRGTQSHESKGSRMVRVAIWDDRTNRIVPAWTSEPIDNDEPKSWDLSQHSAANRERSSIQSQVDLAEELFDARMAILSKEGRL